MALQRRLKREPLNWDGTSIKDHLIPEDWKSLNDEIAAQVEQKNDRGVAIVLASMVEDRLRWLIETKFVDGLSENKKNWIFNGTGPLSSFVAKTEVAFALGLIQEAVRNELKLIGRIRNKFAHEFRPVRFTDPEITKLCNQLWELDAKLCNARELVQLKWAYDDPMKVYGAACFTVMIVLFAVGQVVIASNSSEPEPLPEKSE